MLTRPVELVVDEVFRLGLAVGVQLYASTNGVTWLDHAEGLSTPSTQMTTMTPVPWLCATKAVTATVVAQLCSDGGIGLNSWVREFDIDVDATIDELLSHRTPWVGESTVEVYFWPELEQAYSLALKAFAHTGRPGRPAEAQRYSSWQNWAILGHLVEVLAGAPFAEVADDYVLSRVGISHTSSVGGRAVGSPCNPVSRLFLLPGQPTEAAVLPYVGTPPSLHRTSPGSGGFGPMRDLARVYEYLVSMGLRPAVAAPRGGSARGSSAAGLRPEWSEGFACVGGMLGSASLSTEAFGQGGGDSVISFADPALGLVFCACFNGLVERRWSRQRNGSLVAAVLESAQVGGTTECE